MTRRTAAAAVVLALLTAACGSTSKHTATKRGAKSSTEAAATGSEPAASSSAAEPTGGAGAPSGGTTSTPAKGASKTSGSSGGTGGGAPSGGTGVVAGLGPGTISIGVHYNADQAAAYTAFGVKGSAPADEKAEIQAFVSYVNAHGGMGGRKVEPVILGSDEGSGTWSATAQSACDFFTQDHHVFAVLSTARPYADMAYCLAKRKTPVMIEYDYFFDKQAYDDMAGFLYQPSSLNASRWGTWIDQLAANGYFDRGARIGLIRYDTKTHTRVSDGTIKPALAAHGLKLTDEIAVSFADSQSGVAAIAQQVGSAILRFRNDRVDHVLFLGTAGAVPFFFLPAASAQGYQPRYGLTSNEQPDFLTYNVPASQLHGAVSAGWFPYRDVPAGRAPANAQGALCEKILRDAGVKEPSRYALGTAVHKCDNFLFLKAALDRVSQLTPAALQAAIDGLGTAYASPATFATRFAKGRHDGADATRASKFDDGCACFTYVGAPRTAP